MKIFTFSLLIVIFALFASRTATAQPNAYTYQGFLKVNGVPANGTYEAQFALFDAASGGALLITSLGNIVAVNGVFTQAITFGPHLTGANRFLEIRFRPSGSSEPFTVLTPRQQIFSAPYAVRSVEAANAAQLGGVAANQYVLTTDPRLTSTFNISGTGSANIFNAETQFNIGGGRVLSTPGGSNTFVGAASGANHSSGFGNSFFGFGSGTATTVGNNNSFFGFNAGQQNSAGVNNAFFGFEAGKMNSASNNSFFGFQSGTVNTTGTGNAFFGAISGGENTTGADNSFFGVNTGRGNTAGSRNSFFGRLAGRFTTTGDDNTFVGFNAGDNNTAGGGNTALGANANLTDGVSNATAIGFRAFAAQNNSLILGGINGVNGALANTRVGIGTTTPTAKLTLAGSGAIGSLNAARFDLTNTVFGGGFMQNVTDAGAWQLATTAGQTRLFVNNTGAVGIGTTAPDAKLTISGNGLFSSSTSPRIDLVNTTFNGGLSLGVNDAGEWIFATTGGARRLTVSTVGELLTESNIVSASNIVAEGLMSVGILTAGGNQGVCRTQFGVLATCGSSLRYKTNLNSFGGGLDLIRKLRPVTFNWKTDNTEDLGLVAEEVAAVEPLLTTRNEKGETEGVKYDRVGVVLINAVSEQQTQIESLEKKLDRQTEIIKRQRELLTRQQAEIDALKQLACTQNAALPFCQPKK